jgi:glycosyltransferase involved in cell wall biosynthesis
MRIAQVSPLVESVPPRGYGGTERVVSYLTEALVEQGHELTLFASADSVTSAELVPCAQRALRFEADVGDPFAHMMLMLERVRARADAFDVLHFHTDYYHFPLFRTQAKRALTTLHGRQDLPHLRSVYFEFREMPLVSISNAQRRPVGEANFISTVHHGLPLSLYRASTSVRDGYLAFLGRISPEKRCDRAIEIAKAAGLPLKIAAKVDKVDRVYFEDVVAPLIKQPGVEYIGEIEEGDKNKFLAEAAALVFPIDWPEPFGLAMIEAMACGTPVLAFRCGSVPEIIEEGVTGHSVSSVGEAIERVDDVLKLDRNKVRQRFEERFSAGRMAKEYVNLYRTLLEIGDMVAGTGDLKVVQGPGLRPGEDRVDATDPKGVVAA